MIKKMLYFLKEQKNAELKKYLEIRLKRRGLTLLFDEPVVSHGPHQPNMPFTVWICLVRDNEDGSEGHVALYPKTVFWIHYPDWWKTKTEDRVYCK